MQDLALRRLILRREELLPKTSVPSLLHRTWPCPAGCAPRTTGRTSLLTHLIPPLLCARWERTATEVNSLTERSPTPYQLATLPTQVSSRWACRPARPSTLSNQARSPRRSAPRRIRLLLGPCRKPNLWRPTQPTNREVEEEPVRPTPVPDLRYPCEEEEEGSALKHP